MEAVKYLKERERMCQLFQNNFCCDCPLGEGGTCVDLEINNPEIIVDLVKEWSDNNPVEEMPPVSPVSKLDSYEFLGKDILCERCGETHKVQCGQEKLDDGTLVDSNLLQFVKCGDDCLIVGTEGRKL